MWEYTVSEMWLFNELGMKLGDHTMTGLVSTKNKGYTQGTQGLSMPSLLV